MDTESMKTNELTAKKVSGRQCQEGSIPVVREPEECYMDLLHFFKGKQPV